VTLSITCEGKREEKNCSQIVQSSGGGRRTPSPKGKNPFTSEGGRGDFLLFAAGKGKEKRLRRPRLSSKSEQGKLACLISGGRERGVSFPRPEREQVAPAGNRSYKEREETEDEER